MRPLPRIVHALVILTAVALLGAVLCFAIGVVALRFDFSQSSGLAIAYLTLAIALLVALVAGIWTKAPYRVAVPVIALSALIIFVLARDESSPPPGPVVAPLEPTGSQSFAAYRWFLREDAQSRLKEISQATPLVDPFPSDAKAWPAFVLARHAAVREGWEQDKLGREWIDAMAAHAPSGMYPGAGLEGPVLNYAAIRRSAELRWAYAYVRMQEMQPDAAVRLLVPFLRAQYHLQRGASTLVNEMVALACVKLTYEHLEALLKSGLVSAQARAELAIVLREAPGPALILHQAFLGESVFARESFGRADHDPAYLVQMMAAAGELKVPPSAWIIPLFVNVHRTERIYQKFIREVSERAEARQLESLSAFVKQTPWTWKNPLGSRLPVMAAPAFEKAIAYTWTAEDRRIALLQSLDHPASS
ncbi:MAG: hypothetical protein JWM32_1608 [Verrucomicrobia bacterium]|nr:hypothetical protein [Verrucomicrobiota bacterium]